MDYQQPPVPPPSSTSSSSSLFQLNLDANASYTLRGAASWAKVMAVIGILLGIIFFLAAYMIQVKASAFDGLLGNATSDRALQSALTIYTIVFIAIGVIFVISGLFSIKFGNKVTAALRTNDNYSLGAAFAAVRNLFAFRTIVMIIWLLILLLLIIAAASQSSRTYDY